MSARARSARTDKGTILPMTLEEHQRMQQYVEVYRDALSQAIIKEFFGEQKNSEELTIKENLKSLFGFFQALS